MRLALLPLLRGLVLLARFDPAGFLQIGGGAQDVLTSLAPLLAFPLVFAFLALLDGPDAGELAASLLFAVVLLVPMVVSEALARRWGREARWGSYAAAYNWCRWVLIGAILIALAAANVLVALGLPPRVAGLAALLAIILYQIGLEWFLARSGLGLPRGRSALLLAAVELAGAAPLLLFGLLHAGDPHFAMVG